MVKTNRAQRVALHGLYTSAAPKPYITDAERSAGIVAVPLTYRQFRRSLVWGDFGSVMVQWCGMWVGIEADGHTHS